MQILGSQHQLLRWWLIIKGAIGSDGIVVSTPHLDQYLSLLQGIENFTSQQLISHLAIE
jgi:hypothetical protein